MKKRSKKLGFSLVEATMSAGISVVVITMSLGMMLTSLASSRQATAESEQVQDTRSAVDRLLADVRVSDRVLPTYTANFALSTSNRSIVLRQPIMGPTGLPMANQFRVVGYRIERINGKDILRRYQATNGVPTWSAPETVVPNVDRINLKFGGSYSFVGDGATRSFQTPPGVNMTSCNTGNVFPINLRQTATQLAAATNEIQDMSGSTIRLRDPLANGRRVTFYVRLRAGFEGPGASGITPNQVYIELRTQRRIKGKPVKTQIVSAALLQSRR